VIIIDIGSGGIRAGIMGAQRKYMIIIDIGSGRIRAGIMGAQRKYMIIPALILPLPISIIIIYLR
jgi:actin-related protein